MQCFGSRRKLLLTRIGLKYLNWTLVYNIFPVKSGSGKMYSDHDGSVSSAKINGGTVWLWQPNLCELICVLSYFYIKNNLILSKKEELTSGLAVSATELHELDFLRTGPGVPPLGSGGAGTCIKKCRLCMKIILKCRHYMKIYSECRLCMKSYLKFRLCLLSC